LLGKRNLSGERNRDGLSKKGTLGGEKRIREKGLLTGKVLKK